MPLHWNMMATLGMALNGTTTTPDSNEGWFPLHPSPATPAAIRPQGSFLARNQAQGSCKPRSLKLTLQVYRRASALPDAVGSELT